MQHYTIVSVLYCTVKCTVLLYCNVLYCTILYCTILYCTVLYYTILRKHENEKKRLYEQRVREVEFASFTPLVLSATGGMAKQATIFYKRLASLLASKREFRYSQMMNWLRCRLSYSLLRSAIQCIRGARSSYHLPDCVAPVDLVISQSHLIN